MNKPRLIERITQQREERRLNKPKYKIANLYCSEIIYVYNTEFYRGSSIWNSKTRYSYKVIKPFAIFHHTDFNEDYLHVKTNFTLRPSHCCNKPGEYFINHKAIKDFDKYMQRYMIANNLKTTSKLSINDIKELEEAINKELYPKQEKDEVFY